MMKLPTKKAVDRYLKDFNAKCPFCGTEAIESICEIQHECNRIWQDMQCPHCQNIWRDEYRLDNISVSIKNHERWYSDEAQSVKDMYIHEYQDVIDRHNKKEI